MFLSSGSLLFKDYSTLEVRYWDLPALVHEQETRHLKHFDFLVRELVEKLIQR